MTRPRARAVSNSLQYQASLRRLRRLAVRRMVYGVLFGALSLGACLYKFSGGGLPANIRTVAVLPLIATLKTRLPAAL